MRGTTSHLNLRAQLTLLYRYDFEYEEDDEQDTGDVDIENKYYNAKQMKINDPEGAIEEFLGIPGLETEKGDWGFKGLKQAIKLEFKLGLYDKVKKSIVLLQLSANDLGRRALHRTPHICQERGHPKLLRKVYQQHPRLSRERI
jgi:hypothetical protein